jgi:Flp pilus assembly protein TadD
MWQRYIDREGRDRHSSRLLALLAFGLLVIGCSTPQVREQAGVPPAITPALQNDYQAVLDLMQAERWREASERLQAITQQQPGLAGPWVNLGIAQNMLGETEAAEAAFRESLEHKANNPVACNLLGLLYRRSGRLEEARAMYMAALEVAPDDPDTHWNLGILYDRYLPDASLALQHYERYQTLTGSDNRQLLAWIDTLRKHIPAETITAEAQP